MNNAITNKVSKGVITLDKLEPSRFKKDVLQAQIRQIFTTVSEYPKQRIESDRQESLFDVADFKIESQTFTSEEKRVAFIFVPMGTTEAVVKAKLAEASKTGTIYKVLSNAPILDSNQQSGVDAGLTTVDIIANKQAVRYPVGHADEGKLILDAQGNVQYRRTYFWKTERKDEDLRNGENVYLTPELKAELEGAAVVYEGQII